MSVPVPWSANAIENSSDTALVLFNAVTGVTYSIIPYFKGITAEEATEPRVVVPGQYFTEIITVAHPCQDYTFRVQVHNSDGSLGDLGEPSKRCYVGQQFYEPSGNTYNYSYTTFHPNDGVITYSQTDINDVSFGLVTVDGSPAWTITAGGKTDTLFGVQKVIFMNNRGAFLFGSGGSSVFTSVTNVNGSPSAVNLSADWGSSLLFAGNATYVRDGSQAALQLNGL